MEVRAPQCSPPTPVTLHRDGLLSFPYFLALRYSPGLLNERSSDSDWIHEQAAQLLED